MQLIINRSMSCTPLAAAEYLKFGNEFFHSEEMGISAKDSFVIIYGSNEKFKCVNTVCSYQMYDQYIANELS